MSQPTKYLSYEDVMARRAREKPDVEKMRKDRIDKLIGMGLLPPDYKKDNKQ
jgi:hypothetical protein